MLAVQVEEDRLTLQLLKEHLTRQRPIWFRRCHLHSITSRCVSPHCPDYSNARCPSRGGPPHSPIVERAPDSTASDLVSTLPSSLNNFQMRVATLSRL